MPNGAPASRHRTPHGQPRTHYALRLRWRGRYYGHLVAAGGASAICALILANLVGFGSGSASDVRASHTSHAFAPNCLAHTRPRSQVTSILLGATLNDSDGAVAALIAWSFLFAGVHLMIDLEHWRTPVPKPEQLSH